MVNRQNGRRYLTCSIATLAYLISATTLAFAQADAKPLVQNWRPKDGLYIIAGTKFTGPCEDAAQYLFALGKKSVIGNESFGCEIKRLTDKGPGMLRLDMTCDNADLAATTDNPEERRTKEVMTLRKIDEKSFFMRMTDKGKFAAREWRVSYCPRAPEPSHIQSTARDPTESRRRAVEGRVRLAAWLPRDGVYANPDTDFEDHCMKAGDAVVSLSKISISIGVSRCEISDIADGTKDSIRLDVVCDHKPNATGVVIRKIAGDTLFAPPGSEKMVIAKIDDRTISLRKSLDGEFSAPAQQLSYCPEAAQRGFAEKTK